MSKELFKVGLFYLVAFLVIMLVVGVFMFATIRLGIMPNITPELLKTRGLRALWPFLIMFFSSFAMLYSAYFFAPALVVLRGQSASEAMRLSFLGFWRNWKPILYMGMFGFILLLAGTLPAGLGLLIVVPVLLLTSYTSYSDIYEN